MGKNVKSWDRKSGGGGVELIRTLSSLSDLSQDGGGRSSDEREEGCSEHRRVADGRGRHFVWQQESDFFFPFASSAPPWRYL